MNNNLLLFQRTIVIVECRVFVTLIETCDVLVNNYAGIARVFIVDNDDFISIITYNTYRLSECQHICSVNIFILVSAYLQASMDSFCAAAIKKC